MSFGTIDGKWNTQETKSNVLVNSVYNDGLSPSDTRTSLELELELEHFDKFIWQVQVYNMYGKEHVTGEVIQVQSGD